MIARLAFVAASFRSVVAFDCHIAPDSLNTKFDWYAGCAGAVWQSGNPSPDYCTNGKKPPSVGVDDAKGRWGWWAECCIWDGSKCQTNWNKIDCDADPPISPNRAQIKEKGCAGAKWMTGGWSSYYCENKDDPTRKAGDGNIYGARGRYPWLEKCCVWTGSKCVDKKSAFGAIAEPVASTTATTPTANNGMLQFAAIAGWVVAAVAIVKLIAAPGIRQMV